LVTILLDGILKQNLSRLFPDDRERYQEEKSAFIRFITSLSEKKKQSIVPFQMGKHEYGIGFTCDCFPKSRFNNEIAGKRTGVTAQASFSNPLYSKILFTVTKAFSDLIYELLEFFHWLDGHKKTIKPLSGIEDNIT
jgi:hypothetical protein